MSTDTPADGRAPSDFKIQKAPAANESRINTYVDVARAAFGYDHSKEAVREHTLEADLLVEAVADDLIGFCSADIVVDKMIPGEDNTGTYLNGAAIVPDYQAQGVGRALMAEAVLAGFETANVREAIVYGTTQNPAVVSMLEEFGLYPRPSASEPLPLTVEAWMKPLAWLLAPEKQFDPPVIRRRYDGVIYADIPDHPYRQYTDDLIDYEQGDAVLCAGRVERAAIERKARTAVSDATGG